MAADLTSASLFDLEWERAALELRLASMSPTLKERGLGRQTLRVLQPIRDELARRYGTKAAVGDAGDVSRREVPA